MLAHGSMKFVFFGVAVAAASLFAPLANKVINGFVLLYHMRGLPLEPLAPRRNTGAFDGIDCGGRPQVTIINQSPTAAMCAAKLICSFSLSMRCEEGVRQKVPQTQCPIFPSHFDKWSNNSGVTRVRPYSATQYIESDNGNHYLRVHQRHSH